VFISNVCVVVRGEGPLQHSRRALYKSLEYSSWPFVGYLHAINKAFGRYPTHAVAMSSDGPDTHYPAYDYVAVAKAVLETFVRYMNTHLYEGRLPGQRAATRQVMTESYAAMFGPEQVALARNFAEFACTVEEVADTTLALCSGMFDAMGGQVVMLDRGAAFVDNIATLGPRLVAGEQ
jgi:enoyl-[acyl-carrier-protein] reductase (NADH)